MIIALEVIGALIVVGLLALGVERYIEFLKKKSAPPPDPGLFVSNPYLNGEQNVKSEQDRLAIGSGSNGHRSPDGDRR